MNTGARTQCLKSNHYIFYCKRIAQYVLITIKNTIVTYDLCMFLCYTYFGTSHICDTILTELEIKWNAILTFVILLCTTNTKYVLLSIMGIRWCNMKSHGVKCQTFLFHNNILSHSKMCSDLVTITRNTKEMNASVMGSIGKELPAILHIVGMIW